MSSKHTSRLAEAAAPHLRPGKLLFGLPREAVAVGKPGKHAGAIAVA